MHHGLRSRPAEPQNEMPCNIGDEEIAFTSAQDYVDSKLQEVPLPRPDMAEGISKINTHAAV